MMLALTASVLTWPAHGQDNPILQRAAVTEIRDPVPPIVTTSQTGVPSDAIMLFDGTGLGAWESVRGDAPSWTVENGALTVAPGSGDIRTKRAFGDVQLHVEWRTPTQVIGNGQGRGNSGVFLMDRYEVQVLDSFENPTYVNGQAASVYKQHIPLVNASKGPGDWQTYDIVFTAPRFGAQGRVLHPATVTVLHNGVLVQNHVPLTGPTEFIGQPSYEEHGKAPLRLQDHGNLVSFRNLWIREL
jgi:hypothetical protein